MNHHRFTQEEKQMPSIRLPFRILVLCGFDLTAALLCGLFLYTKGNLPGAAAVLLVLGIPAFCGGILWFNHIILFDKDHIVCRDPRRRLHRFRYEDITKIVETDRGVDLWTGEIKVTVNTRSGNSKWLLELAEKKSVPHVDQKKYGDDFITTQNSPGMLIIGIGGAALFLGFDANLLRTGEEIFGIVFCSFMGLLCVAMTAAYFLEKIRYNEEKLVCSNLFYFKKEFLWEDLIGINLNLVSRTLYFKNGKAHIFAMMAPKSDEDLFNMMDRKAGEKSDAIREKEGDQAADDFESSFIFSHRGGKVSTWIFGNNVHQDPRFVLFMSFLIFATNILLVSQGEYTPDQDIYRFVFVADIVLFLVILLYIILCRNLHRMSVGVITIMLQLCIPTEEFFEKLPPDKYDYFNDDNAEPPANDKIMAFLRLIPKLIKKFGRIYHNHVDFSLILSVLIIASLISSGVTLYFFCTEKKPETGAEYHTATIERIREVHDIGLFLDREKKIKFLGENDESFHVTFPVQYKSAMEQLQNEVREGMELRFYGIQEDAHILVYTLSDMNGKPLYTMEDTLNRLKAERQVDRIQALIVTALLWFSVFYYIINLRNPAKAPKWFLRLVINWDDITEKFAEQLPPSEKQLALNEIKNRKKEE